MNVSTAAESSGSTSKVVALVCLVLAFAAAFLLKDKESAAAGAALAGVAGAFSLLILGASREAASEAVPGDDGVAALLAAIERNRAEFAHHVAGLRKEVAACKADEVGVRESGAVRAEIARLRDAVAKA